MHQFMVLTDCRQLATVPHVGSSVLAAILAQNLRRLRSEREVTQEKLGQRAGLQRNVVGRLERAELNPTFRTVERVAAALGVHPLDLLRDPSGPSGTGDT